MEGKKNKNIGMVLHSVGNNIGSARGNYTFYRTNDRGLILTEEAVQGIKRSREKAIQGLETQMNNESGYTPDEAMLKFMDQLRASDWSTEESLLAFKRDVYDPFIASSGEETREVRNQFRNPLR